MSNFGYNQVDISKVESVRLKSGQVSPKVDEEKGDEKTTLSKEQRRKAQLVDFLEEEFEKFLNLFNKLMGSYYSYGRRNEFVTEAIDVPDYVKCENCSEMRESDNGELFCYQAEVIEDGETLYKIIPDKNTVPIFCPEDRRIINFPKERLDGINERIRGIASSGYGDYVERQRESYREGRKRALDEGRKNSSYVTKDAEEFIESEGDYTARRVTKLTRDLFDPRDEGRFRKCALKLSWLLHLDDALQEDYHPQRAEAYLRTLDARHSKTKLPGQGGDEFEKAVRNYLRSIGLPMFDRVFELEGVSASYKEMDVYTELPSTGPVIFEIFTRGSHSDKDKQLKQYAELLQMAEGVEPAQILLSDGYSVTRSVDRGLLYSLIDEEMELPGGTFPPLETSELRHEIDELELLGYSESLSYDSFKPEYQPVDETQRNEAEIMAKLRNYGFDPKLPVYRYRHSYGLCGPTIVMEQGDRECLITFRSSRELNWTDGSYNERMRGGKENDIGMEWRVDTNWKKPLQQLFEKPVAVVDVDDREQSELTPWLFDILLRM